MHALNVADQVIVQSGVLAAADEAHNLLVVGQLGIAGGQQGSGHAGQVSAFILAVVQRSHVGQGQIVLCIVQDELLLGVLLGNGLQSFLHVGGTGDDDVPIGVLSVLGEGGDLQGHIAAQLHDLGPEAVLGSGLLQTLVGQVANGVVAQVGVHHQHDADVAGLLAEGGQDLIGAGGLAGSGGLGGLGVVCSFRALGSGGGLGLGAGGQSEHHDHSHQQGQNLGCFHFYFLLKILYIFTRDSRIKTNVGYASFARSSG